MYLETYPYKIFENLFAYEFISIGPNGHIRKIGRFFYIANNTYNLEFGDFDTKKVLARVARIVFDFTVIFPSIKIVAIGRTHSRTRLYRMGITKYVALISSELLIVGYINGKWEYFENGKDYTAFLVHRK